MRPVWTNEAPSSEGFYLMRLRPGHAVAEDNEPDLVRLDLNRKTGELHVLMFSPGFWSPLSDWRLEILQWSYLGAELTPEQSRKYLGH